MKNEMLSELTRLHGPQFCSFVGASSDLTNYVWSIERSLGRDFVVRTVRGTKMPSSKQLFNEFAAAFQFPDYFGENWDALDECLTDLSWLPGEGYVLVIRDALDVLSRWDAGELRTLFKLLGRVSAEWSTPVERGEAWDRGGRPFRTLLHATFDDFGQLNDALRGLGVSATTLRWQGVSGDIEQ